MARQRRMPPPPSRPPGPPGPALRPHVDVAASTRLLGEMGPLWLPPYQRAVAWSAEQQVELVRSVWSGLPMPPIVVLTRHGRRWLLDGQQRMVALGLDVRSADGQRRAEPPTCYDPETGEWSTSHGVRATVAGIAGALFGEHRQRWRDAPGGWSQADGGPWDGMSLEAWCAMCDHARQVRVVVLEVAPWWGDPRLGEVFRALATPGVPWSPDELEALTASVLAWSPG